jgi:hypothetical protein
VSDKKIGGRYASRAAQRVLLLLPVVCLAILAETVEAQLGLDDIAPPPVQIVHKEDLDKLNGQFDTKQKTQAAIGIMNARLSEAEQAFQKTDYEAMFLAFGQFHGLMTYSLDFLSKSENTKSKSLDVFRKFELALKAYQTRLEMIHRELPLRWEEYTRKLIKYVRDGRSKALQPMFSDTVLPVKTEP